MTLKSFFPTVAIYNKYAVNCLDQTMWFQNYIYCYGSVSGLCFVFIFFIMQYLYIKLAQSAQRAADKTLDVGTLYGIQFFLRFILPLLYLSITQMDYKFCF